MGGFDQTVPARWIARTQGISRPVIVMWSVEKTLVVEGPSGGKDSVHPEWWRPGWVNRSRCCPRSETSWTSEGDCIRRVHTSWHLSTFYFPLSKCSSYVQLRRGCVYFQFFRRRRRMHHNLYYKRKYVCSSLIHCFSETLDRTTICQH